MKNVKIYSLILIMVCSACNNRNKDDNGSPSNLYEFNENLDPRWVSFENPTGEKGKGGMENNGAKGHPSDRILAGETKTLLHIEGR